MRVDIISCLPRLLDSFRSESILKRACDKGLISIYVHNVRDYSLSKHKKVDDYAYGTMSGMVLTIEPIVRCIEFLCSKRTYDDIIFMAPDGDIFDQQEANKMSLSKNLIILCGRYKGVDQRVRDHYITREISIGNYVLSGGELACAVLIDSIARLIPGAISDGTSALSDSYQDGLLSCPVYSRPYDYKNLKVPDMLLSGNQKKIEEWQIDQSIEQTKKKRRNMYNKYIT